MQHAITWRPPFKSLLPPNTSHVENNSSLEVNFSPATSEEEEEGGESGEGGEASSDDLHPKKE